MNYRSYMSRGLLMLIVFLAMFLIGCNPSMDLTAFTVNMESGYGNQVVIGKHAPLVFDITNNSKDFEGTIQVIVPISDTENIMVEKQLSLAQNAQKQVTIVVPVEVAAHKYRVCLTDKRDSIVWDDFCYVNIATTMQTVRVGVLSDDFNALGYMDKQIIWGTSSLTSIYQLSDEMISQDWHALEMLDVIMITDYSTDLLTDAQISKLSLWVENGGLLMVGTGSTAKKTLSKLNDNLFNITVGNLQQYRTKYGVDSIPEYIIYNQTPYYGGSSYSDYQYSDEPYNDEEYLTLFDEEFKNSYDILKSMYFEDFLYEYYINETDFENDSYYAGEFYTYCLLRYYYESYQSSIIKENSSDTITAIEQAEYVDADVLDFTWDECSPIYATVEAGSDYMLAGHKVFGKGEVLVCSVDFTKNPLANYECNSYVFNYLIYETIGEKISNAEYSYDVNNYYGGGYYYDSLPIIQLKNKITSANMPPIVFYAVLLVLYLFAIILCFSILKRKKKTILQWILFPITAVAFGVLIYCFGFATRIYRPSLNVATVSQQVGDVLCSKSLVGVTIPKSKEYTVSLEGKSTLDMLGMMNYGSYYYDEGETDYDEYAVSFMQVADGTDITLNAMGALQSHAFKTTSVNNVKGLDIKFSDTNNKLDCEITNHFPYTLEDAMVVFDEYIYSFGDLKPGETVILSDTSRVTIYLTSLTGVTIADVMNSNHQSSVLFSNIFGSLFPDYKMLKMRHAMLEYCDEALLKYYSDDMDNSLFTNSIKYTYSNSGVNYNFFFFSFAGDREDNESVQANTNYREYREQMITATYSQQELANILENSEVD